MEELIYLDHNATTPLDERVLEAMMPYFVERYGNASSLHEAGTAAATGLSWARGRVAELIGADVREVVFTSGGTEADNIAVFGVAKALQKKGKNHIVTSAVEHPAVLEPVRYLEKQGYDVTIVGVDENGLVSPGEVEAAIRPNTALVSVMYANNETGVVQPLSEIGEVCREKGVIFHTDAVQAAGKIPINVDELGCDLLSIAAHKFYGPKGVGVLYVRRKTPILPVYYGGHHEQNIRPGTENVPGAVGLARALEVATEDMEAESARLSALRDRLEELADEKVGHIGVNGGGAPRVPNTTNISFHFVEGESILLYLNTKGVCASTGSACASKESGPSHVLTAMGIAPEFCQGAIRFSLGRSNTAEQVEYVVERLAEIVPRLRDMSPLWDRYRSGEGA